jgi:hypothetical protein
VVGVLPCQRPHFDFVLEIAALTSLINILRSEDIPQDPLILLLKTHLERHPLNTTITTQYAARLSELHAQWHEHDVLAGENQTR